MTTERSRANTFSLQRETTKEKKELTQGIKTMSAQSRTQRSLTGGVPQNFNSFRHVITNSTTADDVSWIVHLRDIKKGGAKLEATSHQVFAFGDTKTEANNQPKLSCDYHIRENSAYVDHLLRKKKCSETPNYAQGFFETGLRNYRKQKDEEKLTKLERNFRNLPLKSKIGEYPEFLLEYKKEKIVKKELLAKAQVLSSVRESSARAGLLRNLPKLHYSALDGRHKNMTYKEVEDMNKCKRNINQTYHLITKEGHLPTVAWESSLREPVSKNKKKKKDDNPSELRSGR